jgi:hypothetical protein
LNVIKDIEEKTSTSVGKEDLFGSSSPILKDVFFDVKENVQYCLILVGKLGLLDDCAQY